MHSHQEHTSTYRAVQSEMNNHAIGHRPFVKKQTQTVEGDVFIDGETNGVNSFGRTAPRPRSFAASALESVCLGEYHYGCVW